MQNEATSTTAMDDRADEWIDFEYDPLTTEPLMPHCGHLHWSEIKDGVECCDACHAAYLDEYAAYEIRSAAENRARQREERAEESTRVFDEVSCA